MSARDQTKIIRAPGRLFLNPTTISGSAPYGGTELGAVRKVAVRLRQRSHDVIGEEFDEPVEFLKGGFRIVGLACLLRQYDNTVVSTVFPSTSTGASSGDKVIDDPGTARPALGSATSNKILFVPENATAHPSVILYRADATLEGEVELMHTIQEERALAVLFKALRDGSTPARRGKMGKLADLAV